MYTKQSLERVWVRFVLFCDTLSQKGHLVSCMTILVPKLQITRSDIPHIKWVVRLVTAYGHFNLPWGIVWVCMSPHTHFIPPPPSRAQMTHLMKHISNYFIKCACELQNIHSSSALDGYKVHIKFAIFMLKKKEECCMYYILCFHLIKDLINVQLSCHLFFVSCVSLSTDDTSD